MIFGVALGQRRQFHVLIGAGGINVVQTGLNRGLPLNLDPRIRHHKGGKVGSGQGHPQVGRLSRIKIKVRIGPFNHKPANLVGRGNILGKLHDDRFNLGPIRDLVRRHVVGQTGFDPGLLGGW